MPIFYIRYDSPRIKKSLFKAENLIRYRILRPTISWVAWILWGKRQYLKNSYSLKGEPLKKGISFVMPARDEEYTLKPCLESLVGVIDQFILIDNGSRDGTLKIMKEFQRSMEGRAEVMVLERPGATLIDMRQEGLGLIKYNWMIRGDADMVFTPEIKNIREFALKQKRATAIYLQKFNLHGDLEHKHRLASPFSGEFFMRNIDSTIKVIEYYGRIEHARIPLYYRMVDPKKLAFFHIDCSKPNERLIYRTCYLDWREARNTIKGTPDFEEYQKLWTLHNFGTLDKDSLEYRYSRLIASSCVALAKSEKEELPVQLKNQIREAPFRFFIEYRNETPYMRHDRENPLSQNFKPTKEDEAWVPSMENFKSDKIRKGFDLN